MLVEFIIGKDGSVSNVSLSRRLDPELDSIAERAVKLMNNWIPARLGDKNVRSKFRLPIFFKLSEDIATEQKQE